MSHPYLQPMLALWAERGERTTCRVDGDCMAPLICRGDEIVIEHGSRAVGPGDVIVFRTPEGFRVQRVVRVQRRGPETAVLVKGDQTHTCLPPVRADQILGTVVEVRGRHGRLRLAGPTARGMNRLMAGWLRFSMRRPRAAGRLRGLAGRLVGLPRATPAVRNESTDRLRRLLCRVYRGSAAARGRAERPHTERA